MGRRLRVGNDCYATINGSGLCGDQIANPLKVAMIGSISGFWSASDGAPSPQNQTTLRSPIGSRNFLAAFLRLSKLDLNIFEQATDISLTLPTQYDVTDVLPRRCRRVAAARVDLPVLTVYPSIHL